MLILSGDGIWSLCLSDRLSRLHRGRHLADLRWIHPHCHWGELPPLYLYLCFRENLYLYLYLYLYLRWLHHGLLRWTEIADLLIVLRSGWFHADIAAIVNEIVPLKGCSTPWVRAFYRTQVNLGSDLWVRMFVRPRPLWNLTDVTLADEDTNSILTDNANRAIQGNVAMQWCNLVANFANNANGATWWPSFEPMQVVPSGGQILN